MSRHQLIIGGGVVGLSLAWELSRRGNQVTVLESANDVGKATSWTAAGILPPANFELASDPMDQLRGLSHSIYPDWAAQLKEITGIDPGLRRCGAWYLANTPGERASMMGMTEYWRELDIECQATEWETLRQREPALQLANSPGPPLSAWWIPDEYQVRCPDLLDALAAACRMGGVQIRCGERVEDIRQRSDDAGVEVDGQWIDADQIVVTAGVWTGGIAASLRLSHSVVPVRGQMLLFKTDGPLLHSIINVGNRYIVCRDDGHTLVGSCEEEVGFQLGTTESMQQSLREFAMDWVPALADAPLIQHWSGLRPMTFDGFPMLGNVPNFDRCFVAAGHYRSGIHLAPGSAVVMADLMTGENPPLDLGNFFSVSKQQSSAPLQKPSP